MKRRFRNPFGSEGVGREIDEELQDHIARRAEALMRKGRSEAQAWAEARARFGDIDEVTDACRTIQVRRRRRMTRSVGWDQIRQDLRYGVRSLTRRPVFAIVALVTLALGMGGTTAVFSLVNSVLLRPYPFQGGDQVRLVQRTEDGESSSANAPMIAAWRNDSRLWSAVAGFSQAQVALAASPAATPRRVEGWRITHEVFGMISAPMTLGGGFGPDAEREGAEPVLVISHDVWVRDLQSDPNAIGRLIEVNGSPARVVGVLGEGFDLSPAMPAFLAPLVLTEAQWANTGGYYLAALGQLSPVADAGEATRELAALAQGISGSSESVQAPPVRSTLTDPIRTPLLLLLGAVALVLAIGCVNVANLLLAQGTQRTRELAVRAAIGAGRGRVTRQLLAESLLLGLIGALLALPVAVATLEALVRIAPPEIPRLNDAAIDPTALLFTLATGLVTALLFGLAPAIRGSRAAPAEVLKEGGKALGRGRRDWLRDGLVAAEVALSLTLLVGAALLLRSAANLSSVDRGFEENVLTAQMSVPYQIVPEISGAIGTFEAIRDRMEGLPGVQAAAFTSRAPLAGNDFGLPIVRTGDEAIAERGEGVGAAMRIVSPGYFDAMGIRLRAGRPFEASDDAVGAETVIINEELARRLGIEGDPAGTRITAVGGDFRRTEDEYRSWAVVGVVQSSRTYGLREEASPELFFTPRAIPEAPWYWIGRELMLVLRSETDPQGVVAGLRRIVNETAPGLPLYDVRTMEERVVESLALERMVQTLLTALGLLAALLAGGGIYGVVSYFVSRRIPEMGLRIALGASGAGVAGLVVRQSLAPVVVGLVVGGAASIFATRQLANLLYAVAPGDPVSLLAAMAMVLMVSTVSAWLPARRAARVDPMEALGSD